MRLAVLALVAACGSGSPIMHGDGGADVDAPALPDAPPVRGTVTAKLVNGKGAAVAGLHVVFIDTDGTTTDVATDAGGLASASVFPGASVTAVHDPANGSYEVTTVLAAAPGDTITLDVDAFALRVAPLDTTSTGTFTVSYPASTIAGTNHTTIFTPCGGYATSPVPVAATCANATIDLVVVAYSAQGAVIGWTEKSGVTFAAGGSATITDTWHTPATVTATYGNLPAAVTNIDLYRLVPTVHGASVMGSGTTSVAVSAPLTATAAMQSVLFCTGTGCFNNGAARQSVTALVDGTATTYSLDVGSSQLPWLGTPVFHPNTNMMSVPVMGTGAVDLFEADLRYVRSNTTIYTWRVFGPAPQDIVFPTLPSTLPGDPTIKAGDTMSATHAFAGESDAIAGYRAAIGNVYDALGTCEASTSATAKPPLAGSVLRFSRSN